jgi:uncharacterized repeat protein (TIGR01451 family)
VTVLAVDEGQVPGIATKGEGQMFSIHTIARTAAAAVVVSILAGPAHAAVGELFAVTGSGVGQDYCGAGTPSSLYELDPENGAATLIAPVMIGETQARHVTGLAFHPSTGVLYAVMNGQDTEGSDCSEGTLLTIDPATGEASIVGTQGSLPAPVPDITFDPYGTLYAWSEGLGDELIIVDTTDGTYTQPGDETDHSTFATGLASDSMGRLYLKVDNLLERVNQYTSETFGGVNLDRQAHNMLAFNHSDALYSGRRSSTGFTLFTINPETGVTATGGSNSVMYISALAFDRGVVTAPTIADLSIAKEVDDSQPLIDTDVVFTLTVYNNGQDTVNNVVVSDTLPSNFTFVSALGDGSYDDASGEWTIASIDSGQTAVIDITATASAAGSFTNSAEVVGSDSYDPDSVPGSGDTSGDTYFEVNGAVLLPTLFSIDGFDPYLWVVDPLQNRSDLAQEITLDGYSICGGNGLTAEPGTDTLFGVLSVDDCNSRRLVTIDPVTAEATDIGSFGSIFIGALAFGEDANTLYATSGNGGTSRRTLFSVDPTDASLTAECVLGENDFGRALAFHDGLLYDATGNCDFGPCQVIIRVIDPLNFPTDPTEPCPATTIQTGVDVSPTSLVVLESGPGSVTLLLGAFTELYTIEIPGESDPSDTAFFGYLTRDSKGMAFATANVTLADLGVSKSATKNRVKGDKFIEYLLQAQSNGPDSVAGVVVTDAIPFGTTLVSVSGGCSETGGVVTCDAGTMDPFTSQYFTMTVQVTCKKCSTIFNTATIGTTEDAYVDPFTQWTIETSVKGKF